MTHPRLRDLALIGDRRTAALLTRHGDVVWYCPGRFDRPSLFAALLDTERGGAWRLELPGAEPTGRRYIEDSSVLETQLKTPDGPLTLTDFMPYGDGAPRGICRLLSPAPSDVTFSFRCTRLRTTRGGRPPSREPVKRCTSMTAAFYTLLTP